MAAAGAAGAAEAVGTWPWRPSAHPVFRRLSALAAEALRHFVGAAAGGAGGLGSSSEGRAHASALEMQALWLATYSVGPGWEGGCVALPWSPGISAWGALWSSRAACFGWACSLQPEQAAPSLCASSHAGLLYAACRARCAVLPCLQDLFRRPCSASGTLLSADPQVGGWPKGLPVRYSWGLRLGSVEVRPTEHGCLPDTRARGWKGGRICRPC